MNVNQNHLSEAAPAEKKPGNAIRHDVQTTKRSKHQDGAWILPYLPYLNDLATESNHGLTLMLQTDTDCTVSQLQTRHLCSWHDWKILEASDG